MYKRIYNYDRKTVVGYTLKCKANRHNVDLITCLISTTTISGEKGQHLVDIVIFIFQTITAISAHFKMLTLFIKETEDL